MIGGRFRAGVCVAGLLLLAGCSGASSGEGGESTSLPAETSATSAAVVTAQASPPPVAPVAEKTAKGAEEFVRYFWAVYDYSYATGDGATLTAISDAACIFCNDSVTKVAELAASGQRISDAHVEVVTAVAPPSDPDKGLIVATVISEHPSSVLAKDGSLVERQPGFRRMQSEVALLWSNSTWKVRDLANDEKTAKPWA